MAEAGLSQQVEEGNYGGLVEVMGHLLAVKERQHTTDAMFEPLQQTIALLKVYEQELPDVVYKQLEVKKVQSCRILLPSTYSFFSSFQPRRNYYFFFVSSNCPSRSVLSLLAIHHPSLLPTLLFSPPLLPLLPHLSAYYPPAPPQELPEKWNNVRKQAALVKQQAAPLQAIEVTSLRRKCASFDVEQHAFRERFRNSGPFRYVVEHPRFPAVDMHRRVNALLHIIV